MYDHRITEQFMAEIHGMCWIVRCKDNLEVASGVLFTLKAAMTRTASMTRVTQYRRQSHETKIKGKTRWHMLLVRTRVRTMVMTRSRRDFTRGHHNNSHKETISLAKRVMIF